LAHNISAHPLSARAVKTSAIRVNWRTGNKRCEKEGTVIEIIDQNPPTVEILLVSQKMDALSQKWRIGVQYFLFGLSDWQRLPH
jgi:hypothetical protein